MRSHLLEGIVRHRRHRPFTYALEHRVFYAALDIDELDEVPRRLRSVSRGRWNLLSFRDEDHFDPPARDVRATILDHLRGEGVDPDGWQITLVTNLARTYAISAGIAEALITTAFGLFVAVPAVWAYNFFAGKVEGFNVEMDNSSSELLDYFIKRGA